MGYYTTQPVTAKKACIPRFCDGEIDGNLLSDGRFNFTWDCENRLISAETLTNLPASVPRVKVDFTYDYMSRRASKTVSSWDGTNWVGQSTNRFVYDGWNLIQELSTCDLGLSTNFYVWGLDLSGSLQGAGGIGGLLAAQLGTNSVVYSYDGNGNMSELISDSGAVVGHYEYSPFGETIVATGPLAKENPFRFSTKYFVVQLAMGDWGRRWYIFSLGRWASEDPLGERGGVNLYGFAYGNPIVNIDYLGLAISAPQFDLYAPPGYVGGVIHVIWTPPTGGDWDKAPECKPCQKVVIIQTAQIYAAYEYGIYWGDAKIEIDENNYSKYSGDAWTASGTEPASLYDNPSAPLTAYGMIGMPYGGVFLAWGPLQQWRFYGKSSAKCVEGKEKGTIYGNVKWMLTYTPTTGVIKYGPLITN